MSGLTILNGDLPTELQVRPGEVMCGGGGVHPFHGGRLDSRSGVFLGGHDGTPRGPGWSFIWVLVRLGGRTYLARSSSRDPDLTPGCFKGVVDEVLVGLWPMMPGMVPARGRVSGSGSSRCFRFAEPVAVGEVPPGPSRHHLPLPAVGDQRVEVVVVDRTGHGVSVFDGDQPVRKPTVGSIYTPSHGFGGGPASSIRGEVVAVDGEVFVWGDLEESGMGEAEIYLSAVYLD